MDECIYNQGKPPSDNTDPASSAPVRLQFGIDSYAEYTIGAGPGQTYKFSLYSKFAGFPDYYIGKSWRVVAAQWGANMAHITEGYAPSICIVIDTASGSKQVAIKDILAAGPQACAEICLDRNDLIFSSAEPVSIALAITNPAEAAEIATGELVSARIVIQLDEAA
jgi:hypothetical protein